MSMVNNFISSNHISTITATSIMASPTQDLSSKVRNICGNMDKTTVLLVGAPGAGKSALINSLISALDSNDKPTQNNLDRCVPTAPKDVMGGHTLMRDPVELTETITIVDNRGWHDWGKASALEELCAQINGERSFVDSVDWDGIDQEEKTVAEIPVVVDEKITCITVVINGKGGVDALQGIRNLIATCVRNTGLRPSVVVTHKDEMSDEQMQKITHTLGVVYGIIRESVFIIRNMTDGAMGLEDESKSRLLDFLARCIADGKKGTKFHERKQKAKVIRIKYQNDKKAKEKEEERLKHTEELEQATRGLELLKINQEEKKLNTEIEKAEIEASMKKDEKIHAQAMQQKQMENYLQSQKESKEMSLSLKKCIDDLAAERMNTEKDLKKEELRHAQKMNKQREDEYLVKENFYRELNREVAMMEKAQEMESNIEFSPEMFSAFLERNSKDTS